MAPSWHSCKNILVIRPDNMGDVIMMTPALRALKNTFACKITLLTSVMGGVIAPYIPYINDTLIYDLPWVQTPAALKPEAFMELVEILKAAHFDGVMISTVYSQNPLPAALMAYMAGIPLRLAYCRENPYYLLTDWVPDKEPLSFIQHQVTRELNLVGYIGAHTGEEGLSVFHSKNASISCRAKLNAAGVNTTTSWIVLHPGVSETKREYPLPLWIKTAKRLHQQTGKQILITGAPDEKDLGDDIQNAAGNGCFSIAGLLNIEEFIALVAGAQLVISVNTASVHIAAATNTPVIVLYALTNPQHTPWKVQSAVLPFSVPVSLQSKNEIIQFVQRKYPKQVRHPSPGRIVRKAIKLLSPQSAEKEQI